MGFDRRAQAGELFLAFEAEDLAGLVVRFRRPSVDALAAIVALKNYEPVTSLTDAVIARCQPVCHEFAAHLTQWNLEDNGVAVPVGEFLAQDAMFQLQVSMTWARVMAGLPQVDEPPAEPSIESTLPMEELAS